VVVVVVVVVADPLRPNNIKQPQHGQLVCWNLLNPGQKHIQMTWNSTKDVSNTGTSAKKYHSLNGFCL
jgi:hypothetical protein